MKYNVGDRVIDVSKFYLLTNPVHYEKVMHISKVYKANARYFSVGNRDINLDTIQIGDSNDMYVYHQSTGKCLYHGSDTKYLHVDTDSKELERLIDYYTKEYLDKAENEKQQKLKELNSKIEALIEEVKVVKEKGVTTGFGYERKIDFVERVKVTLENKLKGK